MVKRQLGNDLDQTKNRRQWQSHCAIPKSL